MSNQIQQGSGENVLREAVRLAQDHWGDRLVAAYALGSLAHGGFSAYVSDGSCTSPLRIIPPVRESSKMPPFHHRVRGPCHDSASFITWWFWGYWGYVSCCATSGQAEGASPL